MTTTDDLPEMLEQFFLRCMSMSESRAMDRLVELDLTMSQAKTLFVLVQASQPMPINALTEHVRLSAASMGRTVDQLVHMGLVERREHPADRRVKLVSVTRAGHEVADQHMDEKKHALHALVDRLGDEDAQRLADALAPILAGDALRPSAPPTSEEIPA